MKFLFIGWVNESGHDKVWSVFSFDNKLYCAWGRRGNKLQFKDHGPNSGDYPKYSFGSHPLEKLIHKKKSKYKEITDPFLLFTIFPNFEEKCVEELTECLKTGKIK